MISQSFKKTRKLPEKNMLNQNKSTNSQPDHAQVITQPPVIYLGSILLGWLINKVFPMTISSGTWFKWVGVIFILIAIIIIALSRREFIKVNTSIRPDKSTTAIITTGPYKVSRNPLYTSLTLFHIALGIVFNNLWILFMVIPAIIMIVLGVITKEEKYLENKFGQQYLDYKSSVRRWF